MANILIIEDDPAACNLATKSLERDGHAVLQAYNGRAGIKAYLESGEIDLVITDILMPEQDGIGVIMELRKHDANLPIIAISGGSAQMSTDFLIVADKLGANICLDKPCSPDALRTAARQALAGVE